MDFQLAHEWLRELEREVEQAAAERQREAEHRFDGAVEGQTIRVILPPNVKIAT